MDSTFCIERTFWCKGVCLKEYTVWVLTSDLLECQNSLHITDKALLECVEGFEVVASVIEIELPKVCGRSSCVFIKQPAEIPTRHALQIACRERGAVSICARGYIPQKTLTVEDQRATYMQGEALSKAWRSGRLAQLSCSQKFSRNSKRWRSDTQNFRRHRNI